MAGEGAGDQGAGAGAPKGGLRNLLYLLSYHANGLLLSAAAKYQRNCEVLQNLQYVGNMHFDLTYGHFVAMHSS